MLAFEIACVFNELTGREPGYSKSANPAPGSFSAFGVALNDVLPVNALNERRTICHNASGTGGWTDRGNSLVARCG